MRKAFTLIEILIVVILLAILAAIVIPMFSDAADQANESAAKTDISTLNTQFELWRAKNSGVAVPGAYAAAIASMMANNADGSDPVLKTEPVMANGYTYTLNGQTFTYNPAAS